MLGLPSDHVAPLSAAAGRYLQVLVDDFTLRREKTGAELTVELNDDTPAIWSRHGRKAVFDRYAKELAHAASVQADIDRVLRGADPTAMLGGVPFPFRYASGGTLPIIAWNGRRYYCLFYREIHPIGWNIANGGCDSLRELINPTLTIERELSEELLIFSKARRKRYVFSDTDAGGPAMLSTAGASIINRLEAVGQELSQYKPWKSAVVWSDEGPDRLVVRSGAAFERSFDHIFLTVTAHDCSIEIDRVAQIVMEQDAVIIHGEMIDRDLLDSVVGLFEVERMDAAVLGQPWGSRELLPDVVFHSGQCFDGAHFEERLEKVFMPWVSKYIQGGEVEAYWTAQKNRKAFDLCPVTEGLIRRVAKPPKWGELEGPVDIFLSHSSTSDVSKVANFLRANYRCQVFMYEEAPPGPLYLRQICEAIQQARTMIVFGTRGSEFERVFIEYEYLQFATEAIKNREKTLITLAPGVPESELPLVLRNIQGVINHGSLADCLTALGQKLAARH